MSRLALLLALVAVTAGCFGAPAPDSGSEGPAWSLWTEGALAYLEDVQLDDGGFGPAKSDYTTTLWVALAVHRYAPASGLLGDADAYLATNAPTVLPSDEGTLSASNRAALALVYSLEAGVDPEDFNGVNLTGLLADQQQPDGGIGVAFNQRMFAAGALAAAYGSTRVLATEACQAFEQDLDSGWSQAPDDTWFYAQGIQSLVVCGVDPEDPLVADAQSLIGARSTAGGGVRAYAGAEPDASTTANAAMALALVNHRYQWPWQDYIESVQKESGAVAFSATVDEPLIKTTAEALLAYDGPLF